MLFKESIQFSWKDHLLFSQTAISVRKNFRGIFLNSHRTRRQNRTELHGAPVPKVTLNEICSFTPGETVQRNWGCLKKKQDLFVLEPIKFYALIFFFFLLGLDLQTKHKRADCVCCVLQS